ncbi:hypothetical protein BZA05DRAFT_397782 [Tricharina praecox]|uniref:uncharacterized protein n=1 Tax=Tricharina praecox TaxID=43433 RepID=UPI00221F56B1|nr:uncharacterized protein BZA05DRAFT_397782 [Tricharina praecox]KAI5851773.1 hypothetical protein BZA05DRAFT_397782 [Tricharina praecox]
MLSVAVWIAAMGFLGAEEVDVDVEVEVESITIVFGSIAPPMDAPHNTPSRCFRIARFSVPGARSVKMLSSQLSLMPFLRSRSVSRP